MSDAPEAPMKTDTDRVLQSGLLTEPEASVLTIGDGVTERSARLPAWFGTVLGIGLIFALWIVVATVWGIRKGIPQPWAVANQLADDVHLYRPNIAKTLGEAWRGYLIGNVLAIGLGLLFVLVPFLEKALMQIAVATYCLPIVAIGPILQSSLKGDGPKVALVALSVFFTTLIGVLVGLRSADRTSLELVRAYGGGRLRELTKVRMRSALPSTFAGLQIAAPAAILGAIIGEYFGGEKGLGIMMIASLQGFKVARTWGIAAVATALAGIGFLATMLIGRRLTSWAPKSVGR
jgi:ABC-type nitrate/sulfonate/bicarbonate transport system permease component